MPVPRASTWVLCAHLCGSRPAHMTSSQDIGKPLSDDAKNNYLAHIELRDGQAGRRDTTWGDKLPPWGLEGARVR